VAVKDGAVLATSYHRKYGDLHAEVALLKKLTPAQAKGATIYVNLEPCCHVGKTAPCTAALIQAGVAQIVLGHEDPNPLVQGKGIQQLREAGIEVIVGVLEAEARALNRPFITYMTKHRPWILLKVAQTLDGCIALGNGESRWITSKEARAEVHKLRAGMDAVMVGSQTVLDDDPALTVRHVEGPNPVRIICDSRFRVTEETQVFHQVDPENTWLITTKNADPGKRKRIENTGAKVILCDANAEGRIDLNCAVRELAAAGITSVLVEGGGTLHAALIRENLFDKFIVAIAPKVIGSDGRSAVGALGLTEMKDVPEFDTVTMKQVGPDIWLELERNVHRNR
ncbi:bifunctional diaminohydroxyphosphoribosylaminopyrimidine deaminase/5-amino-6-(5-phosphoribosylamino)uracil reductase RibD, partial [bacterium]|nr:bifunctional diaminohydroxyphosphoribosylaminopyrimidine deaminase/5-amino-6-(5-phosphoribosylamino)uracil reductase RibD [bacterium]